jgi:hypothetical protein
VELISKIIHNDFFLPDSLGKFLLKSDVVRFRDSIKVLGRKVFGDSGKLLMGVIEAAGACQDSINKINDAAIAEYQDKMTKCGAIKIYGNVTSIDGNSVSIFGFSASAKCSDEDFASMRCDDEGVKGALHEQSNIRLLNYSPNKKTEGSLVIGNTIGVTGYRYSSKTTGTNGFGAEVPVYVYTPCNCMPSEQRDIKRDKKISDLLNRIDALYLKMGMTKKQVLEFIKESNDIDKEHIEAFLKS